MPARQEMCVAPWERDWIETEERHLGRPRASVLVEDETRLAKLPYKVVSYLALGQNARRATTPREEEDFKTVQYNVLSSLNEHEMQELIDYVTWKQEQINHDPMIR